jgi:regulator of RNase E activity RraA
MDAISVSQVAPGIRPLWEGARLAGRVITVQLAEGGPPEGRPALHLGTTAIQRARPGDVIVVDNGARAGMGSWGGLLSRAAKARGIAGVVLDGACRDVDEARDLAFPVFGRGATPRTARGRAHEVSCGDPVRIDGNTVRTGDWVVADGSGVVFIPAEVAGSVRAFAAELATREARMAELIDAGMPLDGVFGAGYEDMIADAARGEAGWRAPR